MKESESCYNETMTPISAETLGGIHLHEIGKLDLLRIYYQETTPNEGKPYSWIFGMRMNNLSFTYYNLWWNRTT